MVFTVGTSVASVTIAGIGELCLNSCLFVLQYSYFCLPFKIHLVYAHEKDIGCLLVIR